MSTTRAQVIVQSQGTQGPPGVAWKGVHNSSNSYVERDVVRDADRNRIYIATQSVPVGTNLPSGDGNSEYWDLFVYERDLPPGLIWKGEYTQGTAYNIDDLVRDPNSNSLYIVIQDVVLGSAYPLTNTTFFELILESIPLTVAEFATVESVAGALGSINTVAAADASIATVGADLNSGSSKIISVSDNFEQIGVVADDLNLGLSSKIKKVSDNVADVTAIADAIADPNSSISQAEANATAAETSAGNASTSASQSAASAGQAAGYATQAQGYSNTASVSATNATIAGASAVSAKEDAQKLVSNPEDTQYTLSDGITIGFSALHYQRKTQALAENINARFLGAYTVAARPTSGVSTGSIIYNTTTQELEVWTGAAWQVGVEGPQGETGPVGPGIVGIDYDSAADSLVITYQDTGLVQQGPTGVGISTITQPQGTSSATFTLTDSSSYSVNLPVVSAVDIAVNASNQLELTFNDGAVLTSTGTIVGPAGTDGTDGASIVDVHVNPANTEQVRFELDTSPATYTSYINLPKIVPTSASINGNSQLQLTLSNGDIIVTPQSVRGLPGADGADGRDGTDGADGADGVDGVGISNVDVVSPSTIRFALSNGGYTGSITLPEGPEGPQGPPGNDGLAGLPGADGPQGRGVASLELLTATNGKYNLLASYTDDAVNTPKTLVGQIDAPADGTDGKGWTAGTYNSNTGVVTFSSNYPELVFTTGDLRGPQGPAGEMTANFFRWQFDSYLFAGFSGSTLDLSQTETNTLYDNQRSGGAPHSFNANGGLDFPEDGVYLITGTWAVATASSQADDTDFYFDVHTDASPTEIQRVYGTAPANQKPCSVNFTTIHRAVAGESMWITYTSPSGRLLQMHTAGTDSSAHGTFAYVKIADYNQATVSSS